MEHNSITEDPSRRFENSFWMHVQTLRALAFALCGNMDEAEDLIGDVLVKSWAVYSRQVRYPDDLYSWFRKFLLAEARLQRKRKLSAKNRSCMSLSELEMRISHEKCEDIISPTPEMDRKVYTDLVHEIFRALSLDQRNLLTLYYVEGLSIQQIADTVRKSKRTIQNTHIKARRILVNKLKDLQNQTP